MGCQKKHRMHITIHRAFSSLRFDAEANLVGQNEVCRRHFYIVSDATETFCSGQFNLASPMF